MKIDFDPRQLVLAEGLDLNEQIRLFPARPTVRILMVVDGSVSFTNSFGIGRVIDLVRANVDGYVRFEVDLARVGAVGSTLMVDTTPGPYTPKFANFRFASQVDGRHVLDDYDEVWCFGFEPGNDGSADDENITASSFASTDEDLAVLTEWMNAGGGVLAMGDHHYLGASMCSRIPRVRSMRRWTNAQQVPPIDGLDRHDTNRPQNAAQEAEGNPSPAMIPNTAERDAIPQRIEVRQYPVPGGFVFERRSRPHPLLCGGDLGIIDVLPDHPHEGWVYEDAEINLGAGYSFGAVSGDEYPSGGATRPAPQAIAWANTLPDPPYNFDKGDSPAKRFAVIGAYDGDRAEVGRVVVDSTWHHWFDMNLDGLAAATPDTEFQKIARYIRNCAVWLAREEQRRQMFARATFWGAFTAIAFEDLRARAPVFELGGAGIDVIGRLSSDCLVRDWIDIFVPDRMFEELLPPRLRFPDPPCWSCPPLELLRCEVMGGILREVLPLRDEMQLTLRSGKQGNAMSAETMAKVMERGAERGLAAFHEAVEVNRKVLDEMGNLRNLAVRPLRQRVSLQRAGIARR